MPWDFPRRILFFKDTISFKGSWLRHFLQTDIKMVVLFDEFLQVCVFSLQSHVSVLIPHISCTCIPQPQQPKLLSPKSCLREAAYSSFFLSFLFLFLWGSMTQTFIRYRFGINFFAVIQLSCSHNQGSESKSVNLQECISER